MLESIKNWYKSYGTLSMFLQHKVTHFVAGLMIAIFCMITVHCPFISAMMVLILAVGKEISDEIQMRLANSVQPEIYHLYDIIVTMAGGVLGIVLVLI